MGRARAALGSHWPEYLIEAAGLGAFMIVAGICVMLVNAPGTIRAVASPDIRRGVVGIAMGLTAIGDHLFALGNAVRGPSEPGSHAELSATRQDGAGRCSLLCTGAICWRGRGCRCACGALR